MFSCRLLDIAWHSLRLVPRLSLNAFAWHQQTREYDIRESPYPANIPFAASAEFVRMVASQANEVSVAAKKHTIMPDHVLTALAQLELGHWRSALETMLAEHKEAASKRALPPSPLCCCGVQTAAVSK